MDTYCYEYPRPMFAADIALVGGPADRLSILLIKRGGEPFVGRWALPGGFIDEGERPIDAARRELAEETGLVYHGPLANTGAFGDPGRDPRGWNVSALFSARLGLELPDVAGGDDAAEAAWLPLDALPEPLAFDHAVLIAAALERLGIG